MQITAVRTLTAKLAAPAFQGSVNGTTANLSWTAPVSSGQSVLAGYRVYRSSALTGPYTLLTSLSPSQLSLTDSLPGTQFYQVEAYDQYVTGTRSSSVQCVPQNQTIIFQPNGLKFGMLVGDIGGKFSDWTAANAQWLSEMAIVDNFNASHIVGHLEFVIPWKLLFPTVKGDWDNAQGIAGLRTLFNNVANLNNGPYTVSVTANAVGNTYTGTSISAAGAAKQAPNWWIDNITYGPVSGGNHGGVYWVDGALGGPWLRIDNTTCLNEMALTMGSIYAALEAENKHIYRFDSFLELSIGGAGFLGGGANDASMTSAMSFYAPLLRSKMPTSQLFYRPTFMHNGVASSPAFLEAALPSKWSCGNYDGTNLVIPADMVSGGKARSYDGDRGFCGQAVVNGPIISKNYKALGHDHQCGSSADNEGQSNNTGVVPPALVGNGRIPDILTNPVYCGSSHHYFWSQGFRGPRCNTTRTFSGQPANYAYPVGGPVVTATNLVAYLAQLGTSALKLGYPAAW